MTAVASVRSGFSGNKRCSKSSQRHVNVVQLFFFSTFSGKLSMKVQTVTGFTTVPSYFNSRILVPSY